MVNDTTSVSICLGGPQVFSAGIVSKASRKNPPNIQIKNKKKQGGLLQHHLSMLFTPAPLFDICAPHTLMIISLLNVFVLFSSEVKIAHIYLDLCALCITSLSHLNIQHVFCQMTLVLHWVILLHMHFSFFYLLLPANEAFKCWTSYFSFFMRRCLSPVYDNKSFQCASGDCRLWRHVA